MKKKDSDIPTPIQTVLFKTIFGQFLPITDQHNHMVYKYIDYSERSTRKVRY